MFQPRSEGRGIPSGRTRAFLPSHDPRSKTIEVVHRGIEKFESWGFANFPGIVVRICARNFASKRTRISNLLSANP